MQFAATILDDAVQPAVVSIPFHPPDGPALDGAVTSRVSGHANGVLGGAEVDLVERDAPHG